MRDVIYFVEHAAGQPRRVSFEIATKAAELAAALGGKTHAVVLGKNASAAAELLKAYPVDTIRSSSTRRSIISKPRRRRSVRRSCSCPTR